MTLIRIFKEATKSVLPHNRICSLLKIQGNQLKIQNQTYEIPKDGITIVGFGKAVIGMAAELQRQLKPEQIKVAILSVPHGIQDCLQPDQIPQASEKFTIFHGAKNNIPDEAAMKSATNIKETIEKLTTEDLLIVLVSGGGSALLPLPIHPLNLEDKIQVTKNLSSKGANIQELNSVRIHLSELKGGKLAQKSKAKVLSLILSDIIDDPIELISSGPTVEPKNLQNPIEIIEKYDLKIKPEILKKLNQKQTIGHLDHVQNVLIGNNKIALKTGLEEATKSNFQSFILTSRLSGEAKLVGEYFANLAFNAEIKDYEKVEHFLQKLQSEPETINDIIEALKKRSGDPLCLITGGETTVKVIGSGKGGRNQEMVLSFLMNLSKLCPTKKSTFLSAGTDGIDGPTDAAGAIISTPIISDESLNLLEYLSNNDSYSFFERFQKGQNLIKIGHTGTNVMDIQMLLI